MPASPSSLSVVTDVVQAVDEPGAELSAADSVRLLTALGSVPDLRKRRGIRHSGDRLDPSSEGIARGITTRAWS